MHVFLTGATGWVGSAVVDELIAAGHTVTGLSRSPEKAAALTATGATALHGTLDDLDALRTAAQAADAVIHTAFDHDFSRFEAGAAQDVRAIETLGAALAGSDRPLIVTSGVAFLAADRPASEDDVPAPPPGYPRRSEEAARALVERGVRVASVRLAPSVHGVGERHGFVPILARLARETGVSAYPGDGANRWAAVHRLDAAKVYRLALEDGASRPSYHAAAEEGIAMRDIAATLGQVLGLPVEPREPSHFGWFAAFASANMAASSEATRERLQWSPSGPTLLEDIARPDYHA